MTELSLTLDERHTADFEMIGNGGFAPLTGFQGSADWERVCAEMRTAAGSGVNASIATRLGTGCSARLITVRQSIGGALSRGRNEARRA